MNRVLEKVIYPLRGHYPVKIGDHIFRGDTAHIFFWRILNRGGFEPSFFNILDTCLNPDSVYCDIGAWIGPTAIYASRICKTVHAFEPDGIAYGYLQKNIEANRIENIITHNAAIATENGFIKMASHGGKPGDSMSSMVNIDHCKKSFRARAIRWKTFLELHSPGPIDFIKMDIEGGEFEIIPSMVKYLEMNKPILHLSLHPAYLNEEERPEKMKSIFSSLDFYRRVLDENGEKTDPVKISGNLQSGFGSFLFLP